MHLSRFSLLLFAFFQVSSLFAQNALPGQVFQVQSQAMRKSFTAHAILPESYAQSPQKRYPVVYLLHGYSGNQSDWPKKVPAIQQWANMLDLIIVTPDGGFGSWYFDSPIDSNFRYQTYVGKELVQSVDAQFRTLPTRQNRAITGLSMGGHGALWLAMHYPETYGAAGSMSGGVDLRPFPKNWEIAQRIGEQATYPVRWEQYSVVPNIERLQGKNIRLLIDCGTEDFFWDVNRDLHKKLREAKIEHDFIARPGAHNWAYWENAVPYQLLFFSKGFPKS
jgi:S-formylglutathione hydrolase FrmB